VRSGGAIEVFIFSFWSRIIMEQKEMEMERKSKSKRKEKERK